MRLLCETNLDESHHDFGEITYCTKCCWKRINLKSNETVHEDSICWCESHVKKHKSLIVRQCVKHKVLSAFCEFCTSINRQNGDKKSLHLLMMEKCIANDAFVTK